jgi:hypothetical protein
MASSGDRKAKYAVAIRITHTQLETYSLPLGKGILAALYLARRKKKFAPQ